MKHFLAFILLFWGLETFGQNVKVTRTIMPRDISDSTKRLFSAQLDSFQKYQEGVIPMDTQNVYLIDSSLITYRKHESGLANGIKMNFGRVGGIGCGYHEGGEPHKITVRVGNNERRNYSLYDFEDSTVWISSLNFKQDKIKFYFKRSSPTLTSLIFFAGDQSSIVNWKRYSRPKIIAVYINDKHWTDLHFEDCTCRQEFEFAPIYNSKRDFILSFVIKESYKGEDERVAVSDIDFDGPGA